MSDLIDIALFSGLAVALLFAYIHMERQKKITKMVNDKFVNNTEKLLNKMINDKEEDKQFKKEVLRVLEKIENALDENRVGGK
ncbi:MAG: hypothetical protein N4A57_13300 [Anaeromicrobium sp.]|jgi:hypothetical protein|uniref:hypothetical protein n=1 Tax=Anaeromicrobium sp. TaxID=1929132 RepID=UPI0025D03B64|nr:hypothetical protein [Anaeromicrobium sp.]MCT4595221.1 hypothetical protein [Anaeromicrobium sp.]